MGKIFETLTMMSCLMRKGNMGKTSEDARSQKQEARI